MHTGLTIAGAVLAILLLPAAAVAEDSYVVLSGAAAIDGKTIEGKDGKRFRLAGIDAPEADQRCLDPGGKDYDCGASSRDALAAMIKGVISCDILGAPQDGARAARCYDFLNNDLAAELVAKGWAVLDRPNGMEYVFNEMEAEARDLGLWQGKFIQPRKWRAGNRM